MAPALVLIVPLATALAAAPLQTRVPPPPSAATQQEESETPADALGFTDDGLRMSVPVMIGQNGPYRFIVDTGAERTVIARDLATALGLAPGKRVRISAMAGSTGAGTFVLPEISIGAETLVEGARLRGSGIEAPALLAGNLGGQGLVGIDTLQGRAVTIDFAARTMTVTPATKRTKREVFGPGDIVVRARNRAGQLVVTDASYEGHKVRVVIDTGAVVSMGNLALRRLVGDDLAQAQPMTLLSVTGGKLETQFGLVPRFAIGDTGFANLPVAFSDAAPFARLGLTARPALFLGMDALRLFGQVRIDFANHELRFAKPKRAATR
ncbi:MAG: aspartyl protease family protein [Sphingomonas sp.]|uniref:retropepsin-like aspartic protease n=2 Tax=Pseudomonadota TaxID=1224 RepID=UPI0030F72B6A